MKPNDAIKRMLEQSGQSASGVSQALGKHRTHLSVAFDRDTTPRVDTLAAIASVCGYELLLVNDKGDCIELEGVKHDNDD